MRFLTCKVNIVGVLACISCLECTAVPVGCTELISEIVTDLNRDDENLVEDYCPLIK